MLLYTRVAPRKIPKRRSRAGCAYCKEKKKKCDEKRPHCARCVERGVACTYEAVQPRQRRKRNSQSSFSPESPLDRISLKDDYQFASGSAIVSLDDDYPSHNDPFSPDEGSISHDENKDDDRQHSEPGRHESNSVVPQAPLRSRPPELAMIAPRPTVCPTLEFSIPAFSEFSCRPNRRALVDHFCNVLSHLIVFREESGNPFQQFVLPLSHHSSPVMYAIYALSSAHLEYRGVQNTERSSYFHNQAIQELARAIEHQGKVNRNEVLAAIMLLVYYEVLVQRGRTNIIDGHLKGAFTILCLKQELNPASLFLERAFGFYDVITALSLGTPPLSTAPSAGGLLPLPPLDAPAASPLTNVDTLLGMATTLWPIMHRLSNLLSVKHELETAQGLKQTSKVAVLRAEFDAMSQAIETALTRWKPCLPPNISILDDILVRNGTPSEEIPEMSRLQSILHNALAYRHSAFVYLYRTIYEYEPSHKSVQKHAHASLRHCVETTAARGPMGALLWPLFVAACEATGSEDREQGKKAFEEVERRQGMTNIGEAWRIVQEVWRRLDTPNEDAVTRTNHPDLWRKISAEMGVSIVFG
ncbi:hypothetical protein F5Y18DRAFT_344986 [Xylariaceae sp. FL1019]|nr:hypothetical protein F5Y18DRAFT_344986 [Xylariaceae sp. FL1019]